jgi:hypothetical protein
MKYAILIVFFLFVVTGAYYTGYQVGSSDKQVEYVTKQVEVIKYVSQERAAIQSRPNAGRAELLKLMHSSKL